LLKRHNPGIKLLLITPPPVCAYRWGDRDIEVGRPPQRTAEHTALYAEKARFVADELGIPYVDLWSGFLQEAGWNGKTPLLGSTYAPKSAEMGRLLRDGLHFTKEGNELCFRLVALKIVETWLEFHPEKISPRVPMWDMEEDILGMVREIAEREE
jgi:isoamyl acetate esterase